MPWVRNSHGIEMMPDGGDSELVRRLIGGEPGAWEDLVRRHLDLLHRSVGKVLAGGPGAADVEDVLQSIFLKLWEDGCRRLRGWQGRSRLSTWLVAVARREALDHLERRRREARRTAAPASGNGTRIEALLGDLDGGAIDAIEAAERARAVQDAVSRLPLKENLLVRLVYFDAASYRRAAAVLGVPINSISPWLGRARQRLQGLLRGCEPGAGP